MMRFGVCGSMLASVQDASGAEWIDQVQAAGFDYIELSLAHLAAMPAAEFAAVHRRLEAAHLPCEACNNFFPPAVRLTGPTVDICQVKQYIQRSLDCAAALGVKVVVFGSSGAKNVPEGYPYLEAWQQIVETLHLAADEAYRLGLVIAIEPLNQRESNIVNTVSEGIELMRQVGRDEVKVLADYYHMALENEDPAILLAAKADLRHVHMAQAAGRTYPLQSDAALQKFFFALNAIPYRARMSIEGYSQNFSQDAVQALAVLKQLARLGEE
jgi:D-psicose/D-tagatose/L-ribulose 3-epimerase